jgi:hypothetical protein
MTRLLVRFAAGGALGAFAAFGWRDAAMREQVARGGEWLCDTTVGLLGGLFGAARPAAPQEDRGATMDQAVDLARRLSQPGLTRPRFTWLDPAEIFRRRATTPGSRGAGTVPWLP